MISFKRRLFWSIFPDIICYDKDIKMIAIAILLMEGGDECCQIKERCSLM